MTGTTAIIEPHNFMSHALKVSFSLFEQVLMISKKRGNFV